MLSDVYMPQAIAHLPSITDGDISFVYYNQYTDGQRNRVVFNSNAITFIQKGEKRICTPQSNSVARAHEAVIIPEGNSIISERSAQGEQYSSLVVSFSSARLATVLRAAGIPATGAGTSHLPLIRVDRYLGQYVTQVIALIGSQAQLSPALVAHKFGELLLILAEEHPAAAGFLQKLVNGDNRASLKNIVEYHLLRNVSVEELAFLANRSLSSFKRDFEKIYGLPPAKYIRERRLEIAEMELMKGRQASELYMDMGYENLSSFVQAYKRKFGVTPGRARAAV